jgi:hypothetical protein
MVTAATSPGRTERGAAEQDHSAQHERAADTEPGGGDRAEERTDDLPDRHRRLEGRDPAAYLTALDPASDHDEGQGRRRAHRAQDEPGEEQLGERARQRHHEEAEPLQRLDRHVARLGIAARGVAAPDRRGQDRHERRDADDPSRPAQGRGRLQRADALDVKGQAHEHERPRERAEEHRDRKKVKPGQSHVGRS